MTANPILMMKQIPTPTNFDTDNDSIADGWEVQFLLNPLNASDSLQDNDSDGLTNLDEYLGGDDVTDRAAIDFTVTPVVWGDSTDPGKADTDGDRLIDKWEVDNRLDPLTFNRNQDPDNDNLTNIEEQDNGTDPNDADTDDDNLPDGWEVTFGLDPRDTSGQNGRDGDPDQDGLPNIDEFSLRNEGFPNGADPFNPDTDEDGLRDGFEFFSRNDQGVWLNPLDAGGIHGGAGDPDNDGFTNLEEQELGTNPWVSDEDPDGGPREPNTVPPDDSTLTATVTPETPHVNNTLTCTPAGAFDPAGDAFEHRFQWYSLNPPDPQQNPDQSVKTQAEIVTELDGWEPIPDAVNFTIKPSEDFGTEIRDYVCVVHAVDQFDNESGRVISNKVTTSVGTREPPNDEFTIFVEESNGVLAASVENAEAGVEYRFEWFRNFGDRAGVLGLEGIQISATSNRLSQGDSGADIRSGDVWYARAFGEIPGVVQGDLVYSNTVTIGGGSAENDAPGEPNVVIQPSNPQADLDDITCAAGGSIDPEGDPVTFSVKWLEFDNATSQGTPLLNSDNIQFTTQTIFVNETAALVDRTIFCEVVAVDTFGNTSATVRSSNVTVTAAGTTDGGTDGDDIFEPDDTPEQAHRIVPNSTAQIHNLDFEDADWLTFTLSSSSAVIIATGRTEADILQLINDNDNGEDTGVDTFIELFTGNDLLKPIQENDDSGDFGTETFTLSAKLGHPDPLTLAPGTYFVRVTKSDQLSTLTDGYEILLQGTPITGGIVDTPNKPSIRPSEPVVTDDLVASVSDVDDNVTLHYLWFVDGVQIPFVSGNLADPNATDRNVLSAFRTRGEQQWQVSVFRGRCRWGGKRNE